LGAIVAALKTRSATSAAVIVLLAAVAFVLLIACATSPT
jgi:hypothetical protein